MVDDDVDVVDDDVVVVVVDDVVVVDSIVDDVVLVGSGSAVVVVVVSGSDGPGTTQAVSASVRTTTVRANDPRSLLNGRPPAIGGTHRAAPTRRNIAKPRHRA
ncbi:MAG TPA: hypothetical protein VFZ79_06665 [Acidimicrobiales bacterium]